MWILNALQECEGEVIPRSGAERAIEQPEVEQAAEQRAAVTGGWWFTRRSCFGKQVSAGRHDNVEMVMHFSSRSSVSLARNSCVMGGVSRPQATEHQVALLVAHGLGVNVQVWAFSIW